MKRRALARPSELQARLAHVVTGLCSVQADGSNHQEK
jgi:hypothetical protein